MIHAAADRLVGKTLSRAGYSRRSEQPPLTRRGAEKAHDSWRPARLMRGALATLACLSQVAALLGLGLVPAQSASLNQFDGRWSVLVVTDRGDCSIYRYGLIVERGQARYAGSADFAISGSIAPNGTVRASISRGSNRANVRAALARRPDRAVAHGGELRLLGSLDGGTPRRIRRGVT